MNLVKIDIGGRFLFADTNTHPIRVTQDSYLNFLENEVLPCPEKSPQFFKIVVYAGGGQVTLH